MSSSANRFKVVVVSDSAGDTGESVVRAAAVQFYPSDIEIRKAPFISDISDLDRVLKEALKDKAIIAFTLVIPKLRAYLVSESAKAGITCIDLLGPMLAVLGEATHQEPRYLPGKIHPLDEDYFKKVEAVEFAVKYDDGKDFKGLEEAEIVLVGVSRTSKTPLSMYLAHKKYKVANVPLVPEIKPPENLFAIPSDKVFGLRISPDKLNMIRMERLKSLGLSDDAIYANLERINQELEYADEIMDRIGCTVIDVSNKAVEETASLIQDILRGQE